MSQALQERYASESICFGCGHANPEGLRLRSFPTGDRGDAGGDDTAGEAGDGGYEVMAEWTPGPNHRSFPGILNGGIIGTLLDCQCNWCAAHYFMRTRGVDHPPVTVTAEYTVRLMKPTPSDAPVQLRARIAEGGRTEGPRRSGVALRRRADGHMYRDIRRHRGRTSGSWNAITHDATDGITRACADGPPRPS